MLKQAVVMAMFALIGLFTGCQESRYQPRGYAYEEPSQSGYSDSSHADGPRLLGELQAFIAHNPSNLEGVEERAYEIEAVAPDTPAAEAARRILESVRATYDAAAELRYARAIDRARDLADDGRLEEASRILEEFAREFSGSSAARTANEERVKMAKLREAKAAYDVFVHNVDTYRAVNEYDQAVEFIEQNKPKAVAGTPYEEQMIDYIADFITETETHRNQKTREDALPYETLPPPGENTWRTHGGEWAVENGRIRGANPDEEYGRFMVGEDDWKDYVIDMQFTVRGGQFYLGLRGVRTSGFSHSYKLMDVCFGLENAGGTVEMKVTVRDDMVTILSPSLPRPRYRRITEPDGTFRHTHGPVCIFLKRGAQVEFTRLRVKHLGKVAEPTAER